MRPRIIAEMSLFAGFAFVCAGGVFACSTLLGDFEVLPASADAAGASGDSAVGTSDGSTRLDAGAGHDDGGDGGERGTYCDGVTAPPAAVQFLCADFDSLLLGKGWDDVLRSDAGTLERTGDVAFSLPSAVVSGVSGGAGDGAFSWKRLGAKPFASATAKMQINPAVLAGVVPPTEVPLDLVDIRTSNGSVTFSYVRGSSSFPPALLYTGYIITNATFGGAAALTRSKIDQQIPPNVWTELKIVWDHGGKIEVFFGGTPAFGAAGFGSTDTVVTFRVGAHTGSNAGAMPLHRFDNVELSIERAL